MDFKSGLAHCHYHGLHSLVIDDRKNEDTGMVRVFYATDQCNITNLYTAGDFTIKPHNHRQDLTFTLLFGKASHHLLKFGHGEETAYCYRFSSAILGGNLEVERMFKDTIDTIEEAITTTPRKMHWSVVHTVTAEPESVWLVQEGTLAPAPDLSRCWSLSPRLKLSSEGLYQPMDPKTLQHFTDQINSRLGQ